MVSLTTPVCDFGWKAPEFGLPGVDGKTWTLADAMGPNGLLVMFICNHCPYVKAIRPRLVRDLAELKRDHGVHAIAIMSNDPAEYAEDRFENMQAVAAEFGFAFPYVLDASQQVAKAYGAVCTPDFFGYDRNLRLVYRGRLDDAGRSPKVGNRRELVEAMLAVARGGAAPAVQHASIGCSIKWRE